MPSDASEKSYVLATGAAAEPRLLLLDEIFSPASCELLLAAGLAPGMRVAELGGGAGLFAVWMAGVVGPSGSVTLVDNSEAQLQLARKNAAALGLSNMSFVRAGACDTGLRRSSFDLVYSRFLLCHLPDRRSALAEMRALLKPGGLLVCEDYDHAGTFSEPASDAYRRLVEISNAVDRWQGLEPGAGLQLPRLFREAGFAAPAVRMSQPVFLRGPSKLLWEMTLREAAPSIVESGVSTGQELESICAELRRIATDETILVGIARVTQIWARR